MKISSIAAITAVVLGVVGCHQRTNLDYVREHHCVTDGRLHQYTGTTVVIDGTEQTVGKEVGSYYAYDCPNGQFVTIESDQPQFFEDKSPK